MRQNFEPYVTERSEASREVILGKLTDVQQTLSNIENKVGEKQDTSKEQNDPIAKWREYQTSIHANLIRFFEAENNNSTESGAKDLLDSVYVELDVEAVPNPKSVITSHPAPTSIALGNQEFSAGDTKNRRTASVGFVFNVRATTLKELLSSAAKGKVSNRWIILGEPGAGKTTIARHLVWTLCAQNEQAPTPIPIYVSLTRLLQQDEHPFDLAEGDLKAGCGNSKGSGLADLLFEESDKPGRVWLLLDGLDEVEGAKAQKVVDKLHAFSKNLPNAVIAVFSRPVGQKELGADFRKARVKPLTDIAQL
jgi:hypothetical protein